MSCDVVPMKVENKDGQKIWGGVSDQTETSYYSYPDNWCFRSIEEAPRNPLFREDLQLNLSNRNMSIVMSTLNYDIPPDGELVEISEFINRATQWLQSKMGQPSDQVKATATHGGRHIEGGLRKGYLNEKIHRAVLIAQEGKDRGATHVFIG